MQRVTRAGVVVDGTEVGAIGPGLVVLLGVTHDDTPELADRLAAKVHSLRILRGETSLADGAGSALVVSQFTLYGDTRKGRRPSWTAAAPGPVAEPIYERFCDELRRRGTTVSTGVFGAEMAVSLVGDGPVTLVLDL